MIDIDILLTWGACYKKVKAGEIIFFEGSSCNFYYQVVEGRIKWVNINEEGKEYLQQLIEPNDCFGELPLFDGGKYAATAIAEVDSLIIRLHQSSFHQLIAENSTLHFKFSKHLAERLRFKFHVLKEMAHHDPEKRIGALLNYLKEQQQNICPKCSQVKLTRQQIGDMCGLRVETVIRAMRFMHERGEINITKGKVYLRDMTQIIQKPCSK